MSTAPLSVPVPNPTPAPARGGALKRAATRLCWSLVLPAVVAMAAVRYLVPSPMEGLGGGVVAAIARFADENPLIVGLALFIALSEAIRYWRERAGLAAPRASAASAAASARARGRRWSAVRLGVGMAIAIAAALALRSSVVQTYRVVNASMLPTLDGGDRVLVNKLAYGLRIPLAGWRIGGKLPRRGDVVVFRTGVGSGGIDAAGRERAALVVKRVIGLPGDRVSYQDGRVLINGWQVPGCDAGPYTSMNGRLIVRGRLGVEILDDRAYLTAWTPGAPAFRGFTVPPGELFVMGDDREMSEDSRAWNDKRGGGVPLSAIEGRVSRILVGAHREDGRLDFSHVMTPLGLEVREPGVDLQKVDARIALCLKNPPKTSHPPAAQ